MFSSYLLPLILAPLITHSLPTLQSRQNQQTCEQFSTVNAGPFELGNDIWGASPGSQCAQIDSQSGNTIAWSTTATYSGDNDIKSYPNVQNPSAVPCQSISSFSTIHSSWTWSYGDNPPTSADVAYDAFLNPTCNGPGDPHTYEVMIWLAKFGVLQPIGSADTAVDAQIGEQTWKLWSGTNSATGTKVFSFVAPSTVNSYDGDLKAFFDYLVQNQGVNPSLLITSMQAGSEIASGNNVRFETSSFSIGG
ncbi:MAG: hypothetical protein Q9195_005766 [Heterodermia aff. obscurata]